MSRSATADEVRCSKQIERPPGVTRRCKRPEWKASGLCKIHLEEAARRRAQAESHREAGHFAQPTSEGVVKGATKTNLSRKGLQAFVVTEQARSALTRLGDPDPSQLVDPRQSLLDAVRSAHTQRQIWELLLTASPDADFALLGTPPIPGLPETAKGVRIELLQKFLDTATKTAARISKMALDAGIEERMVKLAEQQEALIADTVRASVIAAVGSLRLSPAAEAAAIDAAIGAAASHLRALAAAGGDPTVIEGVAAVTKNDHLRQIAPPRPVGPTNPTNPTNGGS